MIAREGSLPRHVKRGREKQEKEGGRRDIEESHPPPLSEVRREGEIEKQDPSI